MSSNDPADMPQGLAQTLQAVQDALRRRALANSIVEIHRAADKRAGGDDLLRPGLPAQAESSRTDEE